MSSGNILFHIIAAFGAGRNNEFSHQKNLPNMGMQTAPHFVIVKIAFLQKILNRRTSLFQK